MDALGGRRERAANVYSNGESERVIAKAIKEYQIPRHKLVICTKCCGTTRESNEPEVLAIKEPDKTVDYVNQRGLSRQGIFNAVNASLKRLETDYIDLLQIHRFDKTVPVAETMKALHDLVESGKVRYIGASSMWAYQFATMQFTAEKHGWTKFWGPLATGHLARPHEDIGKTTRSSDKPPLPESLIKIINRVEELAKKKKWPMSHVALLWLMKKGISSPIIGFSKVERIDEAIAIKDKDLSEEDMKFLEEEYIPRSILGHS
ncbi:uncharacterized protein KY384_000951 [Bacidia gigantensis]|uniref:uncharacterized protein n=1 Tax=Bacidia gigantensis TaxID=2732470 RepID=UPI001D03803C|nr:uncharacterized protein KY384_000951 [Bacidia gigantensis]KAG8534107.1 hypothetical protein KY384_000951 [Bacidia gigantensis]